MPRLNDPAGIESRPSSVALGEIAIAAGLAGHPMTMCFCEFPASLFCGIGKYYARAIGAAGALQIRTRKDVKTLEERMGDLRIVLLHSPALFSNVAWSIQLASTTSDGSVPCPALFCNFAVDPDSDPGKTVALVCREEERRSIERWLANDEGNDGIAEAPTPQEIHHDSRLTALFHRLLQWNEQNNFGFDGSQVMRSLLAGASVLRAAQSEAVEPVAVDVDLEDYRIVRSLLCSSIVRPRREFCDPLAMDMVGRVNVYLAVKQRGGFPNSYCDTDDECSRHSRSSTTKRELVTRREIADLGNIRSRLVRRLVECLRTNGDGHSLYARMGLVGGPVSEQSWRTNSAADLARRLIPWSLKQVRSRLDRLRKDGVITAERERGNGPWQYALPEDASGLSSPFGLLPTAQELE